LNITLRCTSPGSLGGEMNRQMFAMVPKNNDLSFCELFGYRTRGLPGLEIVGLGQRGRLIKEKLLYLNRKNNIKVPPRRYVICIEDQMVEKLKGEDLHWLELPLLIMYWSMAEIIPIKNLEDCFCGGKINASGKITMAPIPIESLASVNERLESGQKIITASYGGEATEAVIPLNQVLTSSPQY
jgi:hypothetical protein